MSLWIIKRNITNFFKKRKIKRDCFKSLYLIKILDFALIAVWYLSPANLTIVAKAPFLAIFTLNVATPLELVYAI